VGNAQDGCGTVPSKKAQKMLDEAYNNSKLSMDERLDVLRAAVETDPNCMECLFAKARAQYQIASERYLSFSPAFKSFAELINRCPEYHADAYYYAGIIAYGQQEFETALQYFEPFLLFDKTKGRTSRDHDKKEADVAQILPEIRFFVDFYANPVPFDPVRLTNINTPADEYLPMLSPDNAFIFFTRKSMEKAKGDLVSREVELFMMGTWDKTSKEFATPEALPAPFNVGDNYGGSSLSLDNREMFVTVCKPVSSSYKNCDLYVSRYERITSKEGVGGFKWSGLENLGENVNTPDGWEAQPSISADGNTLYFATIREHTTQDKDGNPTIDIYYTTRKGNSGWAKAQPLGDGINTPGNDKSPFLHTDSRTLYFSSNGRAGAGGYDIYYSRQDESGKWSTPKNIGYPINSPQDEHGLIVSTDGSKAYFASSNIGKSQGLDIYSFEVPQKARPEKILILKGDVMDSNGKPVADARIELQYTKSKEVTDVNVDSVDGSYAAVVNLRKDEDVLVSVKSPSQPLAFNSRVFSIADSANTVQDIDMEVAAVENGMTYRMNDIRFATNSADLDEVSKGVLDAFAVYLNENPIFKVEIGGHTDNVGDAHLNLVLSTDRAFEVFGYLQDIGVDPQRMRFKGYGDTKPLVPNNTAENRARNRRTEFTLTTR
jgi:outer membrane protein OmpA-like peptidoglycan-associated protein